MRKQEKNEREMFNKEPSKTFLSCQEFMFKFL